MTRSGRPFAGVIFDKDGTLFDFNATWAGFMRDLLATEARDAADRATLAEALGFDVVAGRFRPDSIVIAETTQAVARVVAQVTRQGDEAAVAARLNGLSAGATQQPAADLVPLMARLRAMGLTLGVVTNDAEAPARRHLQDAGVLANMAFVAGYDSGFGAKPAPGQLLAFCAATGLDPARCVMVGDSTHDLDAGHAAGMARVGVLTGPAARATLAPRADVVLDSIAQLPDWLTANA